MNYPEYVLRRSETLWNALEEAWQRELTTAAGVVRGGADAESAEGESAARRLAEKLFPSGGAAAAETVQALAARERETRGLAEGSGTNAVRGGDGGGARWLADELGRGTTEGVAPERVRESEPFFAHVYETADLQTLSQSVERDARRYDGGFLLY